MDTYVLVSFWLGVISLAINLICVAGVNYPRVKEETLGQKVFQVLVGAGFVAWSGYLSFVMQ